MSVFYNGVIMKRTFTLNATFGQQERHDLDVTLAQARELDSQLSATVTLAAIIRHNWPVIYKTLRSFPRPCPEYESMWQHGSRTARLEDAESGAYLPFVAVDSGPFFTHENQQSGRMLKTR